MKYLSAILLLGACFFNLAWADDLSKTQGFTDPQKPIFLSATQGEMVLRLKSNATTGYRWFLKNYDDRLFTLEGYHYIAPLPSKMVGVGGVEEWTFKAKPTAFLAPQMSQVELVYAQPWSTKIPPSTVIHVVTEQQG